MRPSPAMARVRSAEAVPQRPIQRRMGNQYATARVSAMTSAGTMISLPVLEPPKRSHVHLPGAQTLPVYFGEQRPRTHSTCRIPAGYTEKIRAPNGILSIGKGGQALLLSANLPQNLFTSKRQSLAPHKRQK